jgi:hypothetical protein
VSFASITLCVASQRVFIVVSIYFSPETFGHTLVSARYNNKLCEELTATV